MWISELRSLRREAEAPAEVGVVTLDGARTGVFLGGERRELPVFGPGGYCWRPALGGQVLVLKTGDQGEQPCVAGTAEDCPDLAPGEVRVRARGGGEVRLLPDGTVDLRGDVRLNGVPLGDLFAPKAPEVT